MCVSVWVSCQVNEKTIHALYKVENNRSYSIISLLACLSLSLHHKANHQNSKSSENTRNWCNWISRSFDSCMYHHSIAFVSHLPINNLDPPIRPTLSICDIHPQVFCNFWFGFIACLRHDCAQKEETDSEHNRIVLFAFVKWVWKGNWGRRRGLCVTTKNHLIFLRDVWSSLEIESAMFLLSINNI